MKKFEIVKLEQIAHTYVVFAENEDDAIAILDYDYDAKPVKSVTISDSIETVEEIDEVEEALGHLAQEDYEVLSVEIDRLRYRIAELEAK